MKKNQQYKIKLCSRAKFLIYLNSLTQERVNGESLTDGRQHGERVQKRFGEVPLVLGR